MQPQRVAALAATLMLAACGSNSAATPTPQLPTPSPSAVATPSPDTETVAITSVGVGTYDLVAIPVAVLHNAATRHGASQVVVHFTTRSGARTLGKLAAVPVNIGPGETLPVAADCTDACTGATGVTATVTVGAWVSSSGSTVSASPARYACHGCGAGHAHGDVSAVLSARLGGGAAVTAFAVCGSARGTVLGGGSTELVWSGGDTAPVDVPVIVNAPPGACSVGASTGW